MLVEPIIVIGFSQLLLTPVFGFKMCLSVNDRCQCLFRGSFYLTKTTPCGTVSVGAKDPTRGLTQARYVLYHVCHSHSITTGLFSFLLLLFFPFAWGYGEIAQRNAAQALSVGGPEFSLVPPGLPALPDHIKNGLHIHPSTEKP